MKVVIATLALSIAVLALVTPVHAQDPFVLSPQPNLLPPPPPPPPPPRIEVPKIPQMDAPPRSPRAALPRRGSFSDRIQSCLEEGSAMGLGPNERAAYSRSCANSR
jgi:hypothetical protein